MGNLRITAALAALVSIIATPSDAADVLEVPFTTDTGFFGDGKFGPDGPWQAAAVIIGTTDRVTIGRNSSNNAWAAVWPTIGPYTQVLTNEKHGPDMGAVYNITRAQALERMSWGEFGGGGANVMIRPTHYMDQRSTGVGLMEGLTFLDIGLREPGYANANAFLYAMNDTKVVLKQKKSYVPKVGILGLGRPADGQTTMSEFLMGDGLKGNSLLQQMKTNGLVLSNSFGMHIGSAALGQKGTLTLGGYDTSRVVGPVGVFDIQLGSPLISMLDVVLGSEAGAWPFDTPEKDIGGIFNGTDDEDAIVLTDTLRRKKGSVIVNPNPAVPGMYLPNTTCANAAKHLPVRFNETIGYYLWNTEDPAYSRIVNSPAYLCFVFSDSTAANITIKVPMKLLNLTLESPIVDTPTQYFPCHDTHSWGSGIWDLGRSFLQAAFYGVNFERNVTFLAQAPGPGSGQSVVKALKPEDGTLPSRPASYFAESWSSHWTVLKATSTESDTENTDDNSLGGGSIAGIVIGTSAALGLIGAAVWFFMRRRDQQSLKGSDDGENKQDDVESRDFKVDPNYVPELAENRKKIHEMAETPLVSEMSVTPSVSELYTPRNLQELESPLVFSEVPGSAVVYEMPGNETWVQPDHRSEVPHDRK